jgi:two-component system, sensor histidine kinase and response regulator
MNTSESSGPAPGTGCVMVVDDDARSRALACDLLRADGHDVVVAESGPQALRLVADRCPDVILLDVMMPGMDGFEVCRRLKRDPFTAAVPVLIVTAVGARDARLKAIEAGASDFLIKPIDVQEMLFRARNAIAVRRLAAQVHDDAQRIRQLEAVRDELTDSIMNHMKLPLEGLTQLLETAGQDAGRRAGREAEACLKEAIRATATLGDMVDSLLDVRRMKAGEMSLARESVDLLELMASAIESLETPISSPADIRLTGSGARVCCDETLLRRAVGHLLKTAVGRSPDGQPVGVAIEVREGVARVAISDAGPHMTEPQRQALSDLFVEGRQGPECGGAGGLGMTFCKLAVEAHGGSIGVDSEEGKSTTLWFSLPVDDAEPAPAAGANPRRSSQPLSSGGLRGAPGAPMGVASTWHTLKERGTRARFGISMALTSVLPLLSLAYLLAGGWRNGTISVGALCVLLPSMTLLVGLGVYLLRCHELEVARLRRYLEALARGGVPEVMGLTRAGDDMAAIEKCLGVVIRQTGDRIRTIESQSQALLRAEQHRVMIETLGAACHHLGQPATVIRAYLEMMDKKETSPDFKRMIDECLHAADSVSEILRRLNVVAAYETEPYLPSSGSAREGAEERILKI